MGEYGYYSAVSSFNGRWVTRADLMKRLAEDDYTQLSELPLKENVKVGLVGTLASAQDQPKRRFRDDG